MSIEARCKVGGNFLADVASDEVDSNTQIDNLASKLASALENRYV